MLGDVPPNSRNSSGPTRGAGDERLMRLEEATAFNERALEELTAQLLDVDGRMRRMLSRLEALEGRLKGLEAPESSEPE